MKTLIEISDIDNEIKEYCIVNSTTNIENAIDAVNRVGYFKEHCKDLEFNGRYGKFFDMVIWETMYIKVFEAFEVI